MMAGNPNYWSMNDMHPQSQFVYGSNNNINININDNSSSVITSDSTAATTDHHQDFPVRSWSQLLLGGLASGEEERYGESLFQQKKMNIWEEDQDNHVLNLNNSISNFGRINHHHGGGGVHDVKQEVAQSATSCQLYDNHNNNNDDHDDNNYDHHHNHHQANRSNWAHHNNIAAAAAMPVSSPTSCVTSLSNNFLNFSGGPATTTTTTQAKINQELSSECNSTSSGGVSKKARVQQSSAQPALKVRKEKLGDRITSLHQLVSPFGKTDTASVLSEAIGYIRFLQGQIEALSTPYMRNAPANSVQERNCLYPEEAAATGQDSVKNLRSRGLCLVPISCTEKVGNDNGADYWAPAALGGGGF